MMVLLAVGLLLQGCTIQKRSVLPGWHVERAGRVSAITSQSSLEILAGTEKLTSQRPMAVTSIQQAPPMPLKALMAHSPSNPIASRHPKSRFTPRNMVAEFRPRDEVVSDQRHKSNLEPSNDDSSVLKRTFMGLLALTLGVASVPVISLGVWYGSWALVMFIALGVGLISLSWFAWLAAFPNLRSRVRERSNWEAKQQRRQEKRQTRGNKPLWLKNLPLAILVATAVLFFISLSL
jgi:hypothetical protein